MNRCRIPRRPSHWLVLAGGLLTVLAGPNVRAGWTWEQPLPQGNRLHALAGESAADVVAVGEAGSIVVNSGGTWAISPSGTNANLRSIWRLGPADYVVVGDRGTVLRGNPSGWQPMASPAPVDLYAVWAAAPDDIWAGGGTEHAPAELFHWDGENWTKLDSMFGRMVRGLWGSGPDDVYAVGGTSPSDYSVAHWDGNSWSAVIWGTEGTLHSVWGASATDVYAVGESGNALHWDGSEWASLELPTGVQWPSQPTWTGVWGTAANDVWVTAQHYEVLHWGGSDWVHEDISSSIPIEAVRGFADGSLYICGAGGQVRRHYGSGWQNECGGPAWELMAVMGAGEPLVQAVGNSPDYGGVILGYEGFYWMWAGSFPGVLLNGLWVVSLEESYAVGSGMLAWNGFEWQETAAPPFLTNAIWGTSGTDLYAAGKDWTTYQVGRIGRFNGSTWVQMSVDEIDPFGSISGSSSDEIFATARDVNYGGGVVRYDGQSWTQDLTGDFEVVWSGGPGHAYAFGYQHSYEWDGTEWTPIEGPPGRVTDVWGWSPEDLLIGCETGAIYHFDGQVYSDTGSVTTNALNGVWGPDPSTAYAVGEYGTILRWDGEIHTPTPAPSPGPSPTPTLDVRVRIELPAAEVHPGEAFWALMYRDNFEPVAYSQVPTFFILDVYGALYFWPSWTLYDPPAQPAVDYALRDVPRGTSVETMIATFVWPDTGDGEQAGLAFYGAMLNAEMTAILGQMGSVSWGYGPAGD